jgi:hypothetical protein
MFEMNCGFVIVPIEFAGAVLPGALSLYQRFFDPERLPVEPPPQIYTFCFAVPA